MSQKKFQVKYNNYSLLLFSLIHVSYFSKINNKRCTLAQENTQSRKAYNMLTVRHILTVQKVNVV